MADTQFLKHQARKRFGQNFLVDDGVIHKICRSIGARASDSVVEIGPGQGAITASLLESCPTLHVIELDRDLIPRLQAKFERYPELHIHQADALKFDFTEIGSPSKRLRVVGNLPYNISTPLIFHLLKQRECIEDMHFMLQKEVVLRLAARPGDKNYGRLSVMTQYVCDVEALFDVPPECFRPAPKVMSAIVRLTPTQSIKQAADNEPFLADVVKCAFQQRRKTLRNSIKPLLEETDVSSIDIDLGKRAEQLSVEEFVLLSNQLNLSHKS